jgi:hypothetical protein
MASLCEHDFNLESVVKFYGLHNTFLAQEIWFYQNECECFCIAYQD